jgi:Ca2+-binding RTX toxin-like protein
VDTRFAMGLAGRAMGVAAVGLAVLATPALGATGDLDKSFGGDGNDKLDGGGGNDGLAGGPGKDGINGGPGKDRLTGGSGRDRCNGGSGKDRAACERGV